MVARVVIAVLVAGCAAGPTTLAPSNPANIAAEAGRLAPAPPSLRAGVVTYPEVPALRPDAPVDHSHHRHGN